MRRAALPLLLTLAAASAAPSAAASTASVTSIDTVSISAGPGEVNQVYITDSGSRLEITDSAGVVAGGGCEQTAPTKVLCSFEDFHKLTIADLGDGNDTYQNGSTAAKDDIDMGPGDDEAHTDIQDDIIRGGDGNDKLEGGSGDDQIDGANGDDRVIGHSGNDHLFGGRGEDTISGDNTDLANGDDVIEAVDGEKDLVACGGGTDQVRADDIDVIEAGLCDDVDLTSTGGGGGGGGGGGEAPRVNVDTPASLKLRKFLKRGFSFTATFSEPVAFAAALFVPKKAARKFGLGKNTVVIARGGGRAGKGTFRARLTKLSKKKKLRALLARKGFEKLPVVFQALATDADGDETTVKRKLKLTR